MPPYTTPPRVEATTRADPDPLLWRVVAAGAALGLGMGLLNLFVGFLESLLVLFWVALGAAAAWLAWGLFTRRLDLRGALEALLRR
jgi:hypothetical protein